MNSNNTTRTESTIMCHFIFSTQIGDIPYGQLKSYKEIAAAIQRPRAYRFVGSTLAINPYPILIPCHRVIRSDSSFGRFGGGAELKRKLIEMEARYNSSFVP
ncbi:MAG: methylated-DNA--[protein]-cysteine S-methyltransferase [Desulfobacterales bacterium]|nr:MAG: methylated-DNA--[protein]-cysteine S-methyltransferase [Desulfobacterales bacterium]UCD90338.1 MAG: methylated-DNA--[protein]-cysteine S-methyltransferase [Desulfobacterales bacterium]